MEQTDPPPGASVAMFGLHRGGSSITGRLLQLVLGSAGYQLVDQAKRYYREGYSPDDIPQDFFTSLAPAGVLYGPFRSYPLTMRLANLAPLRKILIVRDPRDCLVSSYYAHRGPHDRMDLLRATSVLPVQADCEDSIDAFCIRGADPVRRHVDSMRLLCLHYPETLVFRYEDIFADPCGWLAAIVDQLGVRASPEALDQARLEAVFDAEGEDESQHHRQGRPGDHHRKLSRQTSIYLAEHFAKQLAFFSYGGALARLPGWNSKAAPDASKAASTDDIASLKRLVNDLQRENGFRIEEIALLREMVATLREQNGQDAQPRMEAA